MRAKKQISLTRKTLYGIMLLAVFFSAFGGVNLPTARAQAWTSTHQITYFQGNKPGAVSITFDDGAPGQATMGVSQLNARGLKGTFFIITRRLYAASWPIWQSVAAQGHDIQCHTVTHPNLTTLSDSEVRWELSQSQADFNQNMGQPCITMAYPYTDSNGTVQAIAAEYYVAARGGYIKDVGFVNYYEGGQDQYGSWGAINFYNTGNIGVDDIIVNDQYLTDEQFNDSLDYAILRHGWLSTLFHSIVMSPAT
jgi:peptidoglycan/xylan/chitin deacetylase (PgdA/CDA1 family)